MPEVKTIRGVATEIADLVVAKNSAYDNSFSNSGAFIRLLYPNGISPDQVDDLLVLVRIFDKQMRIANRKNAFGESPWIDIAGYALLAATRHENTKKKRKH